MIFNLNKIPKLIKKNTEISFLFLLIVITVLSTKFYNHKKIIINDNYNDLINNTYFKKTITHIFDNLSPRYKNINHKISKGESFNSILSAYAIPKKEINIIKKNLGSKYNLNNLKTNLIKILIVFYFLCREQKNFCSLEI